jgi:hypothetical protein
MDCELAEDLLVGLGEGPVIARSHQANGGKDVRQLLGGESDLGSQAGYGLAASLARRRVDPVRVGKRHPSFRYRCSDIAKLDPA